MALPIAIIPEYEYPGWFWAIAALPVWVLLAWWLYTLQRRKMYAMFRPEYIERMLGMDFRKVSRYKSLFLISALICIVLALANPRMPGKEVEVEHKGSDIIIALDISQSMLVKDVAPERMKRAVRFGNELIDRLKGERIGLVFFAGSAFTQMPLSMDYRVAKMFVQNANPAMASNQGTAIGDAIDLAMNMYEDDRERGRAIIIISDGEDHDQQTLDKISLARKQGVVIFTVGVGTKRGGPVPQLAFETGNYMLDEQQQPVISRFNPDFMKRIAEEGKGQYFELASDKSTSEAVASVIAGLDKGTLTWQSMLDFESYFQYPLLLGLLLYCLFIIWPYNPIEMNSLKRS